MGAGQSEEALVTAAEIAAEAEERDKEQEEDADGEEGEEDADDGDEDAEDGEAEEGEASEAVEEGCAAVGGAEVAGSLTDAGTQAGGSEHLFADFF